MKILLTIVSASALMCSFAFAESASSTAVQNEMQNRFHMMNTDELLEKRGTMTTQQERDQLHNELMNRQQMMTKEQHDKFMAKPQNRTPKMKNQGSGQGMMNGQGSGMGKGGGR